jgi:hypothetical protein
MKGDPSARMRFINWFLVAAATMAITLVAKPIQASWLGAFAVGVFVVAVLVSTVGAFWMMWVAFRRGDLAKVCVAAFVPFAFVW